jgi:hypothetical protein
MGFQIDTKKLVRNTQAGLIVAGCSAVWGIVAGLLLGLVGSSPTSPAPYAGLAILGAILGGGSSLLLHTPLIKVLELIGKLPFTYLPFLLLKLVYYVFAWPGRVFAEATKLVVFEKPKEAAPS